MSDQKRKREAISFHVKSSEWRKMSAKTKKAIVEMVKCATKAVREGKL